MKKEKIEKVDKADKADKADKRSEYTNDDGSYVVKKSKKSNIFAFIICIIIAFVIWMYSVSVDLNEQKKTAANLVTDTNAVETTEAV